MSSSLPLESRLQVALEGVPASSGIARQRGASHDRFNACVVAAEMVADFAAVVGGTWLADATYKHLGIGLQLRYSPGDLLATSALLGVVFVLMLGAQQGYRRSTSLLRVRETERVLRVSVQVFVLAMAASFITSQRFSRAVLVLTALYLPALVLLQKAAMYMVLRRLHSRGVGVRRVMVYGAGPLGKRVFSALVRSPKLGLDPVIFVDDDPSRTGCSVFAAGYQREHSAYVVQGPPTPEMIRVHGIDELLVTVPSLPGERFMELTAEAAAAGATISFVPFHTGPSDFWLEYSDVDGLLIASFQDRSRFNAYDWLKRAFDFLAGSLIFLVTLPVFLTLALLVRLSSPGPVLFVQQRVGRRGRTFNLYKFRTMHLGAPAYAYSPRTPSDPRITPIGRFLRRTSLDELPQLLNVLKGEMSLVGPRPEMPFIVAGYTPQHRQRLQVTPGITGLWQLSADRAYLIHENIEYDLYYIRNRNLFMDIAILLHTAVFAAHGI
jgi:exopolysaccharide biosynthesis polyprenyl glycosylphosphotransferase